MSAVEPAEPGATDPASPAEPPAYLAGLNDAQREAVLHEGPPLLILAGAGSGKTRVITSKIAHLLESRGYRPEAILAVAFTNKAAEEMRERVRRYSPAGAGVMIKTFHAFGAWLLRRYGEAIGLERDFTIYDEEDSLALLRAAVEGQVDRDRLRDLAARIARAKDRCLSPEDDLSGFPLGELAAEIDFRQAYRRYQERLRAAGCLDFGDLLLQSVHLLSSQPEVRSRLQSRFRAVLVDEYQDSNHAQFRMLELLYHPANYLCAVGDEDQSIYSFRGAELDNILGFPGHFPGTRVVRLEQNYRSAANILEVATRVVEHNRRRLGKTLWTRKPAGAPVELAVLEDQDGEARFCAGELGDGELASSAILYRMNFQSRPFETLFTRLGIPFRVVGTVRFYEREEVKDALAYLSLAANPRDEIAFRRAVNRPRRGIGARGVEAVLGQRERAGGNLLEAAEQAAALAASARAPGGARGGGAPAIRGGASAPKGLAAFLKVVRSLREALERDPPASLDRAVLDLLTDSGLLEHYQERDRTEDTDRQRNLSELVNATTEHPGTREGLAQFLEGVMLNSMDENPFAPAGKVTLITVHNTKGLEFDRVFLTGLEEGIFPHYASTSGGAPVSGEELEEERRLFYVGATRARERLLLTCCRRRRVFGSFQSVETSRFLSEVPPGLLHFHGREAPGAGPSERFPPGCQVYHEDYGPGVVTRAWTAEGQPMIAVRFDSGRIARFPVKYSSLEKVSRDT